jgi:hypothetical protein
MAYSAGATSDSGNSQASSLTLTIPGTVQNGDVILVTASAVPLTSTPTTLTATSTGTAPVAAAAPVTGTESGASVTTSIWKILAAASDAGKVVTFTPGTAAFMASALVVYSGVDTTNPIDVIQGVFGGAGSISVTCPSLTTTVDEDWAVYIGGGAAEGGGIQTSPSGMPSGSTTRAYSHAASDVVAVITDSNGPVAAGTAIGGGQYTAVVAASSLMTAYTIGLTPVAFSAAYSSTAADGTQTWTVTSKYNGPGTSVLRILPPSSPNPSRPHSFTFALPVSTGTDATYGDPISVLGDDLSAHNTYNTTIVVPSFPIDPWYADNPGNAQQSQETFMLALASWLSTSEFATSGQEENYLIGFSKSGLGAQALQFKHPDVFAATASWDFPAMMTDYDGTDPTFGDTVGGGSAACYGTSANFTGNYELSTGNITGWISGQDFTSARRLWIGGYNTFQADVSAYQSELTGLGVSYDGSWMTTEVSHAWHDDWVAAALASIMPAALFMSGSGSFTAGAAAAGPGALQMHGSGSLAAAAVNLSKYGALALSGSGAFATRALGPPDTRTALALAGTIIPPPFGGTVLNAASFGGAIVLSGNVLGGSIIAVDIADSSLVEWTMQQANITLAEWNDQTFNLTITSGGSAYNLTGVELDMFLKPQAGIPDSTSGVVKLSTATGEITITNAAGGLATVAIPNADVGSVNGYSFYRVDAVVSSKRNTVLYGSVTTTAL